MKKFIFILSLGLALTGCDFRHRISSSGASPEDVQRLLSESISTSSVDSSQIQQFNQDPNTQLFFAEWEQGYQPMGPLKAVAPIDLDLISADNDTLEEISAIRIFFFNKDMFDGTFQNLLVISYIVGGTQKTEVYSNTSGGDVGLIEDGKFSTILAGSVATIYVESFDVSKGNLSTNGIQLKLFDSNDPTMTYGKISNLEAF